MIPTAVDLSPCGVGMLTGAAVLTYNTARLPNGRTSWADFWDVVKYPGKRGLKYAPEWTLEVALLADGVAPGDVNAVLNTQAGVDRDADGLVADLVHAPSQVEALAVARLTLDEAFPHVGPDERRCRRMEVAVTMRLARQPDRGAAEARDAAHQRIYHALHQPTGNCGIDRVAARPQHIHAGLGRLGLRGHHHCPCRHRRLFGRMRLTMAARSGRLGPRHGRR